VVSAGVRTGVGVVAAGVKTRVGVVSDGVATGVGVSAGARTAVLWSCHATRLTADADSIVRTELPLSTGWAGNKECLPTGWK
jgi:hypothetical protein